MSGLQRILKLHGRMKIQGVLWVWDYARDMAVKDGEMTHQQWEESERARWNAPNIPTEPHPLDQEGD